MSVLEERSQLGSIRYRFTHAFFRQTMYEELIAPQRLKLHKQVARSLETQYAKRLDDHAAELAAQFGMVNEGCRLLIQNLDLARRVNDTEAFWFAAMSRIIRASAPQHARERLSLAEEFAQKPRSGISARTYGFATGSVSYPFFEHGRRRS